MHRKFRDLGLVVQIGSGVPRILDYYFKDCFNFMALMKLGEFSEIKNFNQLKISLAKIIENYNPE